MTRQEFVALLTRMEEAWNASDRDKAIACFAEDVFYIDPLRYVCNGRDELLHPELYSYCRHRL
jgi:hypothetical protein